MNSYNVSSVSGGSFYRVNYFRAGGECPGIFGRGETNGGANLPDFSRAIHRRIVV